MSLRIKLTLLYSLTLIVTLGIFSFLLHEALSHSMYDLVKTALENRRATLENRVSPETNPANYPIAEIGGPETFWQILSPEFEIVNHTDNLSGELPLVAEEELRRLSTGTDIITIVHAAEMPLLMYGWQVRNSNNIPQGYVLLARSYEEQSKTLIQFQQMLLFGNIIATVAAAIVGWFVSRSALNPVRSLTQVAQVIGADKDFSRRVPYSGPQDEIGRLATTLNRMLAALQLAYQQEAHAHLMQRQFVADASHELRTPLTTVKGNLNLLLREPPLAKDEAYDAINDSLAEINRMSRLINDLLMLARTDMETTLSVRPVNLPAVISYVSQQFIHTEHCPLNILPVPDIAVVANEDALKQILLALLDNAFKFTSDTGSVTIKVTERSTDVLIAVEDTGIGIPSDALPRIFDRFFQVDSARSVNGHGLGLSIAYSLVSKQGGYLSVESRVGQGSTFTVALPRAA